ncbi:MAG TPA: hypothetical protein VIV12_24495, partial [Streptosporangiaceae bacterium]
VRPGLARCQPHDHSSTGQRLGGSPGVRVVDNQAGEPGQSWFAAALANSSSREVQPQPPMIASRIIALGREAWLSWREPEVMGASAPGGLV